MPNNHILFGYDIYLIRQRKKKIKKIEGNLFGRKVFLVEFVLKFFFGKKEISEVNVLGETFILTCDNSGKIFLTNLT